MKKLDFRPYRAGDDPPVRSVPVSVVILTLNEEPNIHRCISSAAWADQVVVVDSGSTDNTVPIARTLGAEVVEQPWLGFSGQREFSLRLPTLKHDWVYFVDADEWISRQLASEIASKLRSPSCSGFAQRFRLIFQGTWIRHCGWYKGSWIVRLVDRQRTKFDGSAVGERAQIAGPIGRLTNDIVDDDLKGLATWLLKHVGYAQLAADNRCQVKVRRLQPRARTHLDTRPLVRAILKDIVFPMVPAKPVVLFLYMYIVRFGILDGLAGLRFCFYHCWYEVTVSALQVDVKQRT
jgi:glycosyltransferase involved in cell wall biosynthesis